MLLQLREIKDHGVDDSQYIHALTYVDLQNERFRGISLAEADRLRALHRALTYVVRQKMVPEQIMKRTLTDTQFAAYMQSLDLELSPAEMEQEDTIPRELVEYLERIRQGDRYTRIANMFQRCKKRDANGYTAFGRYEAKAFACYEEAVMDLCNYVDTDPKTNPNPDINLAGQILLHLDRHVSAAHGEGPDISASGVPRLRGSKSKYTLIDAEPVVGDRLKRHWRQREALVSAALELIYDEPEEDTLTPEQHEMLRQRLAALRKLK